MDYQTGKLYPISGNDPYFATLEAALVHTEKLSNGTDQPYGIWTGQNFGSELLFIIYQGNRYRPD